MLCAGPAPEPSGTGLAVMLFTMHTRATSHVRFQDLHRCHSRPSTALCHHGSALVRSIDRVYPSASQLRLYRKVRLEHVMTTVTSRRSHTLHDLSRSYTMVHDLTRCVRLGVYSEFLPLQPRSNDSPRSDVTPSWLIAHADVSRHACFTWAWCRYGNRQTIGVETLAATFLMVPASRMVPGMVPASRGPWSL